ncbi:ABC transporter permease [Leucobacter chironomi]|uniref:ABC transporter permease n=1 Tax=Leucobacter chironomi TaxID=491918 RepID=UPI000462D149|nr:ABC transporter permease [Leucobacter chironomi]
MSTATQVIGLRPTSRGRARPGKFVSTIAPPLVVGVIVLLGWELIVRLAEIPQFILPAPSVIFARFVSDFGIIISASRVTAIAVVGGILLGSVLAVITAFIVSIFERSSKVVLVIVSVISCAPIVALAPIFNAWFGATNLFSKIAIAAIMVFFPVMVNTTSGLLSVNPLHAELMQSLGASRWQTLLFVRIPGALPSLVDGLKVGASLAVIGIIVAEYFGGTANALGVMIANSAAISQFALTWAAVFAASALGILVYLGVLLLERLIIPWKSSQ